MRFSCRGTSSPHVKIMGEFGNATEEIRIGYRLLRGLGEGA
jgi:hypothetical protein